MKLPRAKNGESIIVADLETFSNWFCVAVSNGESSRVFASHRPGEIRALAAHVNSKNMVLAGFNNLKYDDVILRAIVANPAITPAQVNQLSTRIIEPRGLAEKDANFKAVYSKTPWAYSIDVFQLLNGKGSLKEHACRNDAKDVGESPYPFNQPLPAEGYSAVERYCSIDVANTLDRLLHLWPMVELRTTLDALFDIGDRIYCLSEQGIAQATFLKLHRDRTDQYAAEIRTLAKESPDNLAREWDPAVIISKRVTFTTAPFRKILKTISLGGFVSLTPDGSKWELATIFPEDLTPTLAGVRVQLGVGGLHTLDRPATFRADAKTMIVDLDVTSYYPSILIVERLFPAHMGPGFVDDMRRLRDMRVAAKKAGHKIVADALKIVVNAAFGKLNDVWSPLRSVPSFLRVVVNGQLFLLMLIERLHLAGFTIISANTDGVTFQCPRTPVSETRLASLVAGWEAETGHALERTDYSVYARRDVNCYVAADTAGDIKVKGAFCLQPHQGYGLKVKAGPDNTKGDGLIVRRAAIAFLINGTPIAETVKTARPEELIYYLRCKNGGTLVVGEAPVGKLARWYVGINGEQLIRVNPNGSKAKIPNGESAIMRMNTEEPMLDVDFAHYIAEAEALAASCSP